ncbi:MAG: hypothetical protein ACE5KM_16575 [Planctomycetaceae bacterium]
MSDELQIGEDVEQTGAVIDGEEFEEITSDEVDRVVERLEELIESVQSENISNILEDAMNGIYYLVYDDDDEAEDDDQILSEAA